MQYIGVIDRAEIVFVDSQAYAQQGEQGGRLIVIAWQPRPVPGRASLAEPVPCEVVLYEPGFADVQRRLVGEFGRALQELERRTATPSCRRKARASCPFVRRGAEPIP